MSAPYKFSNTLALGPVGFGSTSSGNGTVVFGSNSPTLTAALANISSNPLMLFGIGGLLLVGVWLVVSHKGSIKL